MVVLSLQLMPHSCWTRCGTLTSSNAAFLLNSWWYFILCHFPVELMVVLSLQLMPHSCWTHGGILTSSYAAFLLDSLWYSHFSLCLIPVGLVVILSLQLMPYSCWTRCDTLTAAYVVSYSCWTRGDTLTLICVPSLLNSWWYVHYDLHHISVEIMVVLWLYPTPHSYWNHGSMFI